MDRWACDIRNHQCVSAALRWKWDPGQFWHYGRNASAESEIQSRYNSGLEKARNGKEIERYRTAFSPAGFVLSLDEMLEEAGVEVWFDTVIVDAEAEGNRLKSITVGNKSGLGKLEAACFIDATGDSDLAFFAGDKVHQEPNTSASWALERCGAAPNKLTLTDQIQIKMLGYSYEKNAYEPGVNGALVSRFIQDGRKRYRNTLDEDYASGKYDRNTRYPLLVPTMPELRHTRCFDAPLHCSPVWTGLILTTPSGYVPTGGNPAWSGRFLTARCFPADWKICWQRDAAPPRMAMHGRLRV